MHYDYFPNNEIEIIELLSAVSNTKNRSRNSPKNRGITKLQNYKITKLRNYEITKLQNYEITKLRNYEITKLQNYKVTKLQNCVKPIRHPVLTPYCTNLTGITQGMVSNSKVKTLKKSL